MEYLRQLVSIAAVLGLLMAVLYWLKRQAGGSVRMGWRDRTGRSVEVVERAALTPQHSLHVVRVKRDLFLFSAGPGGVALVRKLEDVAAEPKEGTP